MDFRRAATPECAFSGANVADARCDPVLVDHALPRIRSLLSSSSSPPAGSLQTFRVSSTASAASTNKATCMTVVSVRMGTASFYDRKQHRRHHGPAPDGGGRVMPEPGHGTAGPRRIARDGIPVWAPHFQKPGAARPVRHRRGP